MKRNYISHSNSFVSVPLNYIACRLTIRVEDNLSLLPYLMYLSIRYASGAVSFKNWCNRVWDILKTSCSPLRHFPCRS